MTERERIILVFQSVHDTLKAEKYLQAEKTNFQLIPLPPSINKGCGLAIAVTPDRRPQVEALLREKGISPIKIVIQE